VDGAGFVLAGGVGSAAAFSPDGRPERQEVISVPGVDEHFWKMRFAMMVLVCVCVVL